MIIGNKNNIALEFVELDCKGVEGYIYLYVNGHRFGYDCCSYNVKSAIENVIDNFEIKNHEYKSLINCPLEVLLSAFDYAFEQELESSSSDLSEASKQHPVNAYYPEFFFDFMNGSELDDCFFRLGDYIFDTTTFLVVPNDDIIRLCVRDDLSGDSTETVSTISAFLGLWRELESARSTQERTMNKLS